MPTPGYVFRDGGATPPLEELDPSHPSNNEFRQRILQARKPPTAKDPNAPLAQQTTTSHQLATGDHDYGEHLTGKAIEAGKDPFTTDLGWRANGDGIDTLVRGIENEELWALVRRFNRQMYHVKAIEEAPPGGLDCFIADEDDFSPDKLRANLERLYITVGVGIMGFGKHIVRLRSWREPRRTAAFAGVYALAWLLNMVMPLIFLTIIVLITVPRARAIMFPHAPLALVDRHTGGVQSPPAGVLGSTDSYTGAPEQYKGMAVEQEASNLISGIASVAISSAAGKHEQANPDEVGGSKQLDGNVPDPTNVANAAAEATASATGGSPAKHDKTKQPMEEAVWAKMRPAMHALGDISDGWERFANALSPTPPFSQSKRLQLAGIVAPLLLFSLFIHAKWVYHTMTLLNGFIFFTDPLQQRGIELLNEKIPDWPKYLELRNTLMRGVPTNAQLTITLLRIGEANRAPLPPPPSSDETPPDSPIELDKQQLLEDSNLDATHSELEDAVTADEPADPNSPGGTTTTPKKKGFGARLVATIKGTTATAVETKLTTDRARAIAGSGHAKDHLGILPSKREMKRADTEGPVIFKARCHGRRGAVFVDSSISPPSKDGKLPRSPCVYFSTDVSDNAAEEVEEGRTSRITWAVSIADIVEVKKIGGLGWKGKLVVGWATEREVKDGIEIIDKNGKKMRATAIKERDELFNRLASMGQQIWQCF